MGNEQSQLNGGGGRGELPWGFQVLRNTNEKLAVEPWFDFVVGINGRQIVSVVLGVWWGVCGGVGPGGEENGFGDQKGANEWISLGQDDGNPMLFQQEVRNCVGGAVTLGVWSAKVSMFSSFPFSPTHSLTHSFAHRSPTGPTAPRYPHPPSSQLPHRIPRPQPTMVTPPPYYKHLARPGSLTPLPNRPCRLPSRQRLHPRLPRRRRGPGRKWDSGVGGALPWSPAEAVGV